MAISDHLALTQDQRALQGSVREFLADQLPSAALRRSAFKEAIAHLGKAIEMTEAGAAEKPAGKLKLQASLGHATLAARGYGAPETDAAPPSPVTGLIFGLPPLPFPTVDLPSCQSPVYRQRVFFTVFEGQGCDWTDHSAALVRRRRPPGMCQLWRPCRWWMATKAMVIPRASAPWATRSARAVASVA